MQKYATSISVHLYVDRIYYETNSNQIIFLIDSFLRNMQMHKSSEPRLFYIIQIL